MTSAIGSKLGTLYGVGVGPGPNGMLPVAALEALNIADLIICPRASHKKQSVARQCVASLDIPASKFREVAYNMDFEKRVVGRQYDRMADEIYEELEAGKDVAYLTIGDTMTYSTYCYLVEALKRKSVDLNVVTFPGISSFSALAASFNWPLGLGKERVLILPCPDDMSVLKEEIMTHDVIVLMKIGHRILPVVKLLKQLNIAKDCVFAHRIGLSEQCLSTVDKLESNTAQGYLSTILIRKGSPDPNKEETNNE